MPGVGQRCRWIFFLAAVLLITSMLGRHSSLLAQTPRHDGGTDLAAASYRGTVVAAAQNQVSLDRFGAERTGSMGGGGPERNATWLRNDPRSLKNVGHLKEYPEVHRGVPLNYMERLEEIPRSRDDEGYTAITEYFWQQSNGVVLEMGGLDGVQYWVSRAIKKLGWHRILIEGSPTHWARAAQVSPDATYVGAAICNSGSVHYLEHSSDPTTNGIVEFMSPPFLSRYYKELSNAAKATGLMNGGIVDWSRFNFTEAMAANDTIKVTLVPCVTLHDVFSTLQIEHINLFVLDVEGSELEVLKSIDFQYVKFDVICVETMNAKASQQVMRPKGFSDTVKALLASNGYQFDFQQARNSWFHYKEFAHKPRNHSTARPRPTVILSGTVGTKEFALSSWLWVCGFVVGMGCRTLLVGLLSAWDAVSETLRSLHIGPCGRVAEETTTISNV